MKRGTLIKTSILLSGLVLIPLFNVTSSALYKSLEPGGDINITPSDRTYKLFVPNNEATAYEEVQGLKLKGNASIKSQISGKYQDVISNYKFNNVCYKDSSLVTAYESLDYSPSSDVYLGYVGYFVKGTNDKNPFQLSYDAKSTNYVGEIKIDGYDAICYEKQFTKDLKEINKYNNLRTSSGFYYFNYSKVNNTLDAQKIIYLEPNANWLSAGATFKITSNKDEYETTTDEIGRTSNLIKFKIPGWHSRVIFHRKSPNGVDPWGDSQEISLISNYSKDKIKFHQHTDPNLWENFGEDANNYWTTL